ncbi:hypothetical protein [Rhizobium sp. RU33A]|uniref:hypothetical protein n=1 Tax=Rhizobium sp. RU33A TaxID=1907413 RepID=UPI000970BEFA|nr:hypothetical protein [Rhizobium sp. RU33A]
MLILGGVLVTLGGTGAAAVYIGADQLLGPSYAELNGLECTEVKTVEIHKKDRFWVRKFITTDEPGDGLARVKTALRVAKTLQETKKADLVQVVVLDASGPKDRSGMRGRAIGADIIYVPDPSHVPEEMSARVLTARYADGLAAPNGEFFGERVDMLEADIQALVAKLNDQTDCVKPEGLVTEAEGHGEKAADGHGKAPAHGAEDAHGEKSAEGHGEADAKGEAEGHGDAPAGEHGEETPVAEHGAEEDKGWMASLMGMVGLGGDEAPADGHAAPADGHGAVAEGHEAPAEDHAEPAAVAHRDAGSAETHGDAATDHAATDPAAHGQEPADAAHAAAPEHGAEQVVHTEEKPAVVDEAAAHSADDSSHDGAVEQAAGHEAAAGETPVAEEVPAEGDGWFSSLKSMVGLGGSEEEAPAADVAAEAKPAEASDGAKSDDHGAAWLEKMRAQPIAPDVGAASAPAKPEEHGATTVPEEDEAVLPPKANIKGDEHAKADH